MFSESQANKYDHIKKMSEFERKPKQASKESTYTHNHGAQHKGRDEAPWFHSIRDIATDLVFPGHFFSIHTIIIIIKLPYKAKAKAPPTTPTAATPTAAMPFNPPRITAFLPAAPLVDVAAVDDVEEATLALVELWLTRLDWLTVEVLEAVDATELAALVEEPEADERAEVEVREPLEVEAPETEPV